MDTIVQIPGALGCATLAEIISENRKVTILSLNGVQPSVRAIANKSYVLIKPFYLVTTPSTPEAARKFAEFTVSSAARRILMKNGCLIPERK